MGKPAPVPGRIQLLDGYRGLCILSMIFFHVVWTAVYFRLVPAERFSGAALEALLVLTGGSFVFISGVSARLSRDNLRRGARILLIALGITAVTRLMGLPIYFGVLHLLGFCNLLWGVLERRLDRLPGWASAALCLMLGVLSQIAVTRLNPEAGPFGMAALWILGFNPAHLTSADYFPVFPWIFLFLIGTSLGKYVRSGALPRWFYQTRCPAAAWLGRRSLNIYLIHEPVIFGVCLLISHLKGFWI